MNILWEGKTYLSYAASLLSRNYVNKRFKTFPKRYCESLYVKGLQSYSPSNIEDDKNGQGLEPGPHSSGSILAEWQNF